MRHALKQRISAGVSKSMKARWAAALTCKDCGARRLDAHLWGVFGEPVAMPLCDKHKRARQAAGDILRGPSYEQVELWREQEKAKAPDA